MVSTIPVSGGTDLPTDKIPPNTVIWTCSAPPPPPSVVINGEQVMPVASRYHYIALQMHYICYCSVWRDQDALYK